LTFVSFFLQISGQQMNRMLIIFVAVVPIILSVAEEHLEEVPAIIEEDKRIGAFHPWMLKGMQRQQNRQEVEKRARIPMHYGRRSDPDADYDFGSAANRGEFILPHVGAFHFPYYPLDDAKSQFRVKRQESDDEGIKRDRLPLKFGKRARVPLRYGKRAGFIFFPRFHVKNFPDENA